MKKSNKQPQGLRGKPKEYRIYGIFNRKKKKLLYVSTDKDQVDLEFDLGDYDDGHCELITFGVAFD